MTTIFTIGHSNKSEELFLDALRQHKIDRVIDVRSRPYSRWCPQFNREYLGLFLAAFDINYDWRGYNLGGLAANTDYRDTIKWVYERASDETIVLLCSEADYKKCHRFLMLTPDLVGLGAEVIHITYENVRDDTRDLLSLF